MKENEMNSKDKEKNISEHQRHINQVKENAAKIINAGTSALTKELQLAIKEREQIIANKLHYMKSPSPIKKLSNEKLYNEREEFVKSIDEEIFETQNLILNLEESIRIIENEIESFEKSSKSAIVIQDTRAAYFQNLDVQKKRLQTLREGRENSISDIEDFKKNYETKIDEFEKEIQLKSILINMLTTASFQYVLLNENRRKKLDLRSELITEFSDKKDEFSNLQNYSNLEIIKIRYYYYQNGHDGENDSTDNALNWPESKLQEKLHSDIKLEKIDYFKFKEIIGRGLLNEFSLSQMEEFNQEPKDVALSSTNEHFEKSKSRYTQMPLNELSQLADQLEEQSKQDALQVEEIQALADSMNKPTYVFSFAFPPLYSVPTPEIRNKIDDELNKAQAKYQQSTSLALEVGLALDARVKNSSKLLSEICNENENDKKRVLATLTDKERKEFVEYLHHQAGVLEKECLEHKKNLNTLKHSFGQFFGKQKSQIEMAKVNLAHTQGDLKKLQQVQSTLAEMKDAKGQKRGEVEAEKRKGTLGFSRVKAAPSAAAREDKAPEPTSSSKSPKT